MQPRMRDVAPPLVPVLVSTKGASRESAVLVIVLASAGAEADAAARALVVVAVRAVCVCGSRRF
jgi:hypothetical protein